MSQAATQMTLGGVALRLAAVVVPAALVLVGVTTSLAAEAAEARGGTILTVFGVSAIVAAAAAQLLADALLPRASLGVRFAFAAITGATLFFAVTAFVFALHYYMNVLRIRTEPLSPQWLVELFFTASQGAIVYGIFGVRLLGAAGLAALGAFAALVAWRPGGPA